VLLRGATSDGATIEFPLHHRRGRGRRSGARGRRDDQRQHRDRLRHAGPPALELPIVRRRGETQSNNVRLEAESWQIYETTNWDNRWEFGGGTLDFGSNVSEVTVDEGVPRQSYDLVEFGSGTWILEEVTLRPVGKLDWPPKYPDEASHVTPINDRLQPNWAGDSERAAKTASDTPSADRYSRRTGTARDDVSESTDLRPYKIERNRYAATTVNPRDDS
jgi:hypothetical protein